MLIRSETPADLQGIHDVHVECFPTTLEARLVDALRDKGALVVSLVAELDGEVVGHAAFSPVTLTGVRGGVGLAPVAVRKGFRRKGIADRLIREGLRRCRDSGCPFVVVLGAPGYYRRFGFETASGRRLADEFAGGDAFQVLELEAGSLPAAGGTVRYAAEFSELTEGGD